MWLRLLEPCGLDSVPNFRLANERVTRDVEDELSPRPRTEPTGARDMRSPARTRSPAPGPSPERRRGVERLEDACNAGCSMPSPSSRTANRTRPFCRPRSRRSGPRRLGQALSIRCAYLATRTGSHWPRSASAAVSSSRESCWPESVRTPGHERVSSPGRLLGPELERPGLQPQRSSRSTESFPSRCTCRGPV